MSHYTVDSEQVYGDSASVQVALRTDSSPHEAQRVRAIAQQVFLLEQQRCDECGGDGDDLLSHSDKSVILLLKPDDPAHRSCDNADMHVGRLPFRTIAVSLLGHQLLLRTIAALMLQRSDFAARSLSSFCDAPSSPTNKANEAGRQKPGYLSALARPHVSVLLLSLDASLQVAHDFDRRPGLKLLIQRVFNAGVQANMCKQAAAACTIRMIALYEMVVDDLPRPTDIKHLCVDKKNWRASDDAESAIAWQRDLVRLLCYSVRRLCAELCRADLATDRLAASVARVRDALRPAEPPFVLLLAATDNGNGRADAGTPSPGDQQPRSASATAPGGKDELAQHSDCDGADDNAEETVYNIVTKNQLGDLLSDYERVKKSATMPSARAAYNGSDTNGHSDAAAVSRANPFDESAASAVDAPPTANEELMERYEQLQLALKDADARLCVYADMSLLCVERVLHCGPDERRLRNRLLALFYDSATSLAAGCGHATVRRFVSQFMLMLDEQFLITCADD